MLKTIIYLLMISYLFSAICGMFAFVADIIKWHIKDKKEIIIPSAVLGDESEVIENERRDNGNGEYNGESDTESDRGNRSNYDIGNVLGNNSDSN